MTRIALIGASGQVGSRILKELSDRGFAVTAIARHPESIATLPNVTTLKGDVKDAAQLAEQLKGHDVVVSAVKFGENTHAAVNAMKQDKTGFFAAAVDVTKGSFRLTTDIFRKFQTQRAINIRTGTVTIGIRGTDVWGQSNAEKDFVCLLEGHIAVSHPLGEPTELTEPLQVYGADKGQPPGPVTSVDKVQLAKWALETELQAGVATQQTGGRWALVYGRFDQNGALTLHDQLSAAGYAGRIRPVRVSGGYLYELHLGQLVTERAAQSLADRLGRTLNLPAPVLRQH